MSEKEELIELLYDICDRRDIIDDEYIDEIADELLAHGVTIPVRCGECIHGNDGGYICVIGKGAFCNGRGTFRNKTCKYGERRADNG